VITTASKLGEVDPRIRSRFMDPHLCALHFITVPSYNTLALSSPPPKRRSKR